MHGLMVHKEWSGAHSLTRDWLSGPSPPRVQFEQQLSACEKQKGPRKTFSREIRDAEGNTLGTTGNVHFPTGVQKNLSPVQIILLNRIVLIFENENMTHIFKLHNVVRGMITKCAQLCKPHLGQESTYATSIPEAPHPVLPQKPHPPPSSQRPLPA